MARTITAVATNNSRNRGILLLALIFAILSGALMFAFLQSRGGGSDGIENSAVGPSETVVVVARDVAVGEQITADMLTTRALPGSALLEGRVVEPDLVIGKVATAPMFAGEQLLLPKVTTFDGEDTLSYKVPAGMRALSLEIPHEAWQAGGLAQPGDRIDVLGITTFMTVDPLTGAEKPDLLAGFIAENVAVLAVSQNLVRVVPNLDSGAAAGEDGDTTNGAGSTGSSAPLGGSDSYAEAISITLALTPEQAAKVAIIDAMDDKDGQYRILVRQKGADDSVVGDRSWSYEDLFATN